MAPSVRTLPVEILEINIVLSESADEHFHQADTDGF